MNEHLARLTAMRDDDGLTWDLSGNDKAAFEWAISSIDRLTRERDEARAEVQKWFEWVESKGPGLDEYRRLTLENERLRAAIESLEQYPWPESVFTCDDKEYQRLVSNPATRTAISGFLMREGWRSAQKQIRRALENE